MKIKNLLPYVAAILVFLAIALIYCAPALDGKVLLQGDVNNWRGAAQEARTFAEETGNAPWWTNSMFSGMPTYQITGSTTSMKWRKTLETISHFGFTGNMEATGIIFAYFFGFFLMLLCFGVNPWLSLAGALAIGFSSYFFLIIPAGHLTKACALASLAPMIGGFYAIFRKRYWLGAPLFVIYGIIGFTLHPQMTYYIGMMLGVLACAELYLHIREKAWKDLGISLAVLLGCALLVLGTKASWMQMNRSYLKETMRGGHSELVDTNAADKTNTKAGLDLDYATAWSYGIGETMTLLIPNWEGGASGYNVGPDSELCETMRKQGVGKKQAEQFCQQVPTYRGEKAFTSGPVYIGAIVCFLFILGLIIVPGPYKWALLIATLCSVFLSWGRNMMWLTELFFQYFPMYNKFRAVESILVVAEITMPILGFLALQQIAERKIEWKKLQQSLFIAGGITGGICLLAALFGGAVDITSSYDAQWTSQMPDWLTDAIYSQRTSMLKADAWRSLIFVALGFAVVYFFGKKLTSKEAPSAAFSPLTLAACLAVLIVADMFPVNKRFFGSDSFVNQKDLDRVFQMQPWEEQILQDPALDFRTLNLATNTFNDSRTSYRLKSIGGYSAAKLRRYQDMIDRHIMPEMNPLLQTIMRTGAFQMPDEKEGSDFRVLNMLNMRYAVVPLQGGQQLAVRNPYAMGNAWFVDEVQFVDTPTEECNALSTINLHTTAVADKRFAEALDVRKPEVNTLMAFDKEEITLTSYKPNELIYQAQTERNRVAVFSEVYYPMDWHLFIDEQEVPIARVNYLLRAAVIPAGQHTIRMYFEPAALQTDKLCSALLIIALILSAVLLSYPLWKNLLKRNKA